MSPELTTASTRVMACSRKSTPDSMGLRSAFAFGRDEEMRLAKRRGQALSVLVVPVLAVPLGGSLRKAIALSAVIRFLVVTNDRLSPWSEGPNLRPLRTPSPYSPASGPSVRSTQA